MARSFPASEASISALSEPGSKRSGKSNRSRSAGRSLKQGSRKRNYSAMSRKLERRISKRSVASRRASPARMSRLPANGPVSPGVALASFMSLRESCASFDPLGLSSRMFPDYSVQTVEETLRKSSAFSWSSAGMGFAGACSTANFSESPNAAAVCSLSEVLESHVPQRFFLSVRAAQGILRRAAKRGRMLPSHLQQALEALAMGTGMHGTQTMLQDDSHKAPSSGMTKQTSSRDQLRELVYPDEPSIPKKLPLDFLLPPLFGNPTGTTGEAAREEMAATISLPPRSRRDHLTKAMCPDAAGKTISTSLPRSTAEETPTDSERSRESISSSRMCAEERGTRQIEGMGSESGKADLAIFSERLRDTTSPILYKETSETPVKDRGIMSVRGCRSED